MARASRKNSVSKNSRSRQCKKISEEKAKKKRRSTFKRRVLFICVAALLSYGGLNGWLAYSSGAINRTVQNMQTAWWDATMDAGFILQRVSVTGRQETSVDAVRAALDVHIGDPLLAISVSEIQTRLTALPEVAHATIERELPNGLHIHITERQPVAIWQHQGVRTLLDADGRELKHMALKDAGALLVITGEDAPQKLDELLGALHEESSLRAQLVGAQRVANRRWNLTLNNGITIKLPEIHIADAWQKLVEIDADKKLTQRAIRSIDMRVKDRLYLELDPSIMHAERPAASQET